MKVDENARFDTADGRPQSMVVIRAMRSLPHIPADVRELLVKLANEVDDLRAARSAEPVAGPVYDGSIEIRLDDKGGVDEIVGLGVICHIERLSNGTWFVCLTQPDQTDEAFWLAGKGSVEVCHREHRPAPTTGPNAKPWALAAAIRKGSGE